MLKRTILASLLMIASPAYAEWQLPAGMSWQTESGECNHGKGDVEKCPYGPKGTSSPAAIAYFRVCGEALESRPFLTVDLAKQNLTFDMGDGTPQVSLFSHGVTPTVEVVVKFFILVQEKRGPCPKERAI